MPSTADGPDDARPGATAAEQVRRSLTAEFGVYSPAEAARRAGSRGHSPTLAVKRWVAARKIFAVPVAGSDHFLGFCFDESGRPHPTVSRILAAVDGRLSGWDLAVWMATANDGLGGERPVDLLDTRAERVVEASQAAADALSGAAAEGGTASGRPPG